jgi:hypothetical protein
MSLEDYERATELIARHSEIIWDFAGPPPEFLIEAAEGELGIQFPPLYRRFIGDYGAGGFGSDGIYGVVSYNVKEREKLPDVVWHTPWLKPTGIPHHLLPIYDPHDDYGEILCLDLAAIQDQEAPVITYQIDFSPEEQYTKVIARDFGEFFLRRVREEIERRNNKEPG